QRRAHQRVPGSSPTRSASDRGGGCGATREGRGFAGRFPFVSLHPPTALHRNESREGQIRDKSRGFRCKPSGLSPGLVTPPAAGKAALVFSRIRGFGG